MFHKSATEKDILLLPVVSESPAVKCANMRWTFMSSIFVIDVDSSFYPPKIPNKIIWSSLIDISLTGSLSDHAVGNVHM